MYKRQGFLGAAAQGADAEADGGHGGGGEHEEGELHQQVPRQAADDHVHEHAHPQALGEDEDAEEEDFAGEVGAGAEAAEFFPLEDEALAGDLARGVVAGHEGDEDDLEHDEAADEAAGLELLELVPGLPLDLVEHVAVLALVELAEGLDAVEGEDDDEQGEAKEHGQVQPDLPGIPAEDGPAPAQEHADLGGEAGQLLGGVGVVLAVPAGRGGGAAVRVLLCGARGGGFVGGARGGVGGGGFDEHFFIVPALFPPGLGPRAGLALGEAEVDLLGVGGGEVMGEEGGRAVVDEAAAVHDEDAVKGFEAGEAVGDVDDDAAGVLAGEEAEEVGDLALGFGVEAAGDFVAEEQAGVGDELEGEAEAALLAAGEDFDAAVGEVGEAGDVEDVVELRLEVVSAGELGAQGHAGGDAFLDGEELVRDAELGHVAELAGVEVLLLLEVAPFPEEASGGLLGDACDDFEQGGLAAAGGADDGHEVPLGQGECHVAQQVQGFLLRARGGVHFQAEIFGFEHKAGIPAKSGAKGKPEMREGRFLVRDAGGGGGRAGGAKAEGVAEDGVVVEDGEGVVAFVFQPVDVGMGHQLGELGAVFPGDVAVHFAMPEVDGEGDGADFEAPLGEVDVGVANDGAGAAAQALHHAGADDAEDFGVGEDAAVGLQQQAHEPLERGLVRAAPGQERAEAQHGAEHGGEVAAEADHEAVKPEHFGVAEKGERRRAADDGGAEQARGHFQRGGEHVGSAAGPAEDVEFLRAGMGGQLLEHGRPVQQPAPRLEIGEADAGPVGGDDAQAVFKARLIHQLALHAAAGPAVEVKHGRAGGVAVFGVAKREAVGEGEGVVSHVDARAGGDRILIGVDFTRSKDRDNHGTIQA